MSSGGTKQSAPDHPSRQWHSRGVSLAPKCRVARPVASTSTALSEAEARRYAAPSPLVTQRSSKQRAPKHAASMGSQTRARRDDRAAWPWAPRMQGMWPLAEERGSVASVAAGGREQPFAAANSRDGQAAATAGGPGRVQPRQRAATATLAATGRDGQGGRAALWLASHRVPTAQCQHAPSAGPRLGLASVPVLAPTPTAPRPAATHLTLRSQQGRHCA